MYSIIDIESNGAGFRKESIIEIAIYKYDGHQIVDQFISLVNPEADITPFVQRLTKISPNMVKTAPKFHEIAKRVVEITKGTTLVGHNIEFDYRMLKQSFERLGYPYKIDVLDTIPMAKKLIPNAESYSLGKLTKSLGIPLTEHHRAAGDARATLDLFKLLLTKDAVHEIIQHQFEETQAKSFSNKIKELTADLPSDRGIVYFQDQKGKLLLSEYSENINRYAKSILQSKSSKRKKIQDQCEQINFELTGNPLLTKLILLVKGMKLKETLPFGLYFEKGNYVVEKISLHTEEKPLLKFKSFTQGAKVVSYIDKQLEFADLKAFKSKIDLKKRSGILVTEGRILGEKAFLEFQSGQLVSFGFYEYHTQVQSRKRLDMLKMELPKISPELKNELQLALLRDEFQLFPLPQ
ncbi:PolC-type DNA polymerase III [Amniculibacterium sp. G2-70]|uniref:3'-5' exonuclease n=1 Tax=Amniculibacterium sp. G2-70 TaxID=2767188 RepID=UPI001653FE66|nr:3'-5' exonuclease [Amniculibacterium sp. G2-70]